MRKPNILLILNDDMGFSDLGCYGGEIQTPNLDRLAAGGLRFTQFYNTARCCPSRASLLTGLHPHQADVGHMIGDDQIDGYLGDLSHDSATIAEVLRMSGYATCMSGKWHVTGHLDAPHRNWPCQRGFDEYYGILCGAASYYAPKTLTRNNTPLEPPAGDFHLTDAISDEAAEQVRRHFAAGTKKPLFQYLAYTAPHWPLHARAEDIARYHGRYDAGWDQARAERLRRMRELGIIGDEAALSPRDPTQPPWEDAGHKKWQARRMEVYAAQIEQMDRGIGRVLAALEEAGELDNTLVLFLADNGGCHEEIGANWAKRLPHGWSARSHTRDGQPVRFGNTPDIDPGPEDTYCSYGVPWANVSNTPFRKYKCWVHEGGISTPLIVHWPGGGISDQGALRRQPAQLPDIMATILDVTGAEYPARLGDREILPHEGHSLRPVFDDKTHSREILTWEHEGNCGIRRGKWKLVREYVRTGGLSAKGNPSLKPGSQEWELYDIEADRSELNNLASEHSALVGELAALWEEWAERCNVRPWEEILRSRAVRNNAEFRP